MMGQHPSDDQVQELIKSVDTDGGGSIGFDEFLTLMTQVLSLLALLVAGTQFTCLTGTQVQILTFMDLDEFLTEFLTLNERQPGLALAQTLADRMEALGT